MLFTLPEAVNFDVEFSRDEAGKDTCGKLFLTSGEVALVPIDITWRKGAEVQPTKGWADAYIHRLSRPDKWRTANAVAGDCHTITRAIWQGNRKILS